MPANCADRTRVLGLSALIAGMDGFGWHRRLQMLAPMMVLPNRPDIIGRLGAKYGWSEPAHAAAASRLLGISAELDAILAQQEASGSEYLVGYAVSAADFYWANFAGLLKPLGPEDNPMPGYLRSTYESADAETLACLTPRLEAHRDRMYTHHIQLPLVF